MKKSFLPFLLLTLFLIPQLAYAGLSEGCFPIVQCDAGQDFYAGSCQNHIEVVADCPNPGAPSKYPAFTCDAGCFEKTVPVAGPPPVCPGGIQINGHCLRKLNVLDDDSDADSNGNLGYKIWDGAELSEVLRVGSIGCADDEVAVGDSSSPTGWRCSVQASVSSLWSQNGSDVYYDSGKVGIGTNNPNTALNVEASNLTGAATIGKMNFATGPYSLALGFQNTASGNNSLAVGWGSVASGNTSIAMGLNDTASGYASVAMGEATVSSGGRSTSMGYKTTASGDISTAFGMNSEAQSYSSLVAGRYNVLSGSKISWVDTDPLFVLGNGFSSSARSNAMTVLKNGTVGINTATPNSSYKLDVNGVTNSSQFCISGDCISAWPGDSASYVGKTTNVYDGNRGGYFSARNLCDSDFIGTHVCSANEMIHSYDVNPSGPIASLSGSVWVNNGPPSYIENLTNDCQGWNATAGTIFGYVWDGSKNASYVTPCNMTRSFACCK